MNCKPKPSRKTLTLYGQDFDCFLRGATVSSYSSWISCYCYTIRKNITYYLMYPFLTNKNSHIRIIWLIAIALSLPSAIADIMYKCIIHVMSGSAFFLCVNEQSTEKYKTSKTFSIRLQHQHMIRALAAAFEVFRVTFSLNRFPLRFLPVSFMLSQEAVQKVFYFFHCFVCLCFLFSCLFALLVIQNLNRKWNQINVQNLKNDRRLMN